MKNNFAYYKNEDCIYFPCHEKEGEFFNCKFCYCPLYALGDQCGGAFTYTEQGIKDCSNCLKPHRPESYDAIMEKMPQLLEMAKKDK